MKRENVVYGTWLLVILIFIFTVFVAYGVEQSNTLFIIEDKVNLKKTSNIKSEIVKELKFGEFVTLIEKSTNNMLYVETQDNKKGWIRQDDASYIPDNWKIVINIANVKFYIPDEKFTFLKSDKIVGGGTTGERYIENKLYNNNYFILVHHIFNSFEKEITKPINSYPEYTKVIVTKGNKKCLYLTGNVWDSGELFFELIQAGNNNDCYDIVVLVTKDTMETRTSAKKIVFSFEAE